jgi:hypothetical protein
LLIKFCNIYNKKKIKINLFKINLFNKLINTNYVNNKFKEWGLGIGDWGLGLGLGPIPNPQSPIFYK